MADMIKRDILPAASAYAGELSRRGPGPLRSGGRTV